MLQDMTSGSIISFVIFILGFVMFILFLGKRIEEERVFGPDGEKDEIRADKKEMIPRPTGCMYLWFIHTRTSMFAPKKNSPFLCLAE